MKREPTTERPITGISLHAQEKPDNNPETCVQRPGPVLVPASPIPLGMTTGPIVMLCPMIKPWTIYKCFLVIMLDSQCEY